MKTWATFCLAVLLLLVTAHVNANCEVTVLINKPYHEDGDTLTVDVRIINGDSSLSMDFYVCIEILGSFYFYPSFSAVDLDHRSFSMTPGQELMESVIPPVVLPDQLPSLTCPVYSVAFEPGTWNLVSNLAIDQIRLNSSWEDLPIPHYTNTFYFMPGVDGLDATDPQSTYDKVAFDMRDHFETPGLYARMGVTILDGLADDANQSDALLAAPKAMAASITIGYHSGVTCHHTFGKMDVLRQSDRRLNQWDSDGTVFNTGHNDLTTLSISRYAAPVVSLRKNKGNAYGRGFAEALASYPDSVVCTNGPIEVELRRSFNDDPHYADYGPFTVMEFRDWLTHSGIYNDQSGEYAGEGFPMELIGNYDFSGDPSPNSSATIALNFNQVFGTDFTTWDLRYWDPIRFPDSLPMDAEPMPQSGHTGHIVGGFDPPRDAGGTLIGGNELFQKVWDGWRSDLTDEHRIGFGFRQAAVQNYIADNSRWLLEGGVPLERNFTHQIPVDFIGNWIRERGSASPFWSAINPYSNAGYTAYFETALRDDLFQITRILSPRWGLFEYHPDPFHSQELDFYVESLELLYANRCQILVPIEMYQDDDGNYQLIGSHFETAVNLFFASTWPGTDHLRFDQPYFNDTWIDYLPPPVNNVAFSNGTLSWSMFIWESRPDITWDDWGEFDHFAIFKGNSPDFTPDSSNRIATTQAASLDGLAPGHYKVLAVTKDGLTSRI